MDAKELRAKSPAELADELLKLRKEQFSLRMQRATGQSPKPDQFGKVRRNIARLKTVQRQALTAAAVKGEAAAAVAAAQTTAAAAETPVTATPAKAPKRAKVAKAAVAGAATPASPVKKSASRVKSAKKTATGGKKS